MNETDINRPKMETVETEAVWRKHYEAFKASGLCRANYGRKYQLIYHRFSYWCRKFNQTPLGTPDE